MASRFCASLAAILAALLLGLLVWHAADPRYVMPADALWWGAVCLAVVLVAAGVAIWMESLELAAVLTVAALTVLAIFYSNLLLALAALILVVVVVRRGAAGSRTSHRALPFLLGSLAGLAIAYLVPLATLPAPVSSCSRGFPEFAHWYVPYAPQSLYMAEGQSRVSGPDRSAGTLTMSNGATYRFTCGGASVTSFQPAAGPGAGTGA